MEFLLAIIGGFVGSIVNLAIFRLGYEKNSFSPWSQPLERSLSKSVGYIPVLGWFFRRQEAASASRKIWIRSGLIEAAWIIGLPMLFNWHLADGLTRGVPCPVNWAYVWFIGHALLIALLCVATFIDFDQRIIPDSITVTGVIAALAFAASFPSFRLPVLANDLEGMTVRSLHFADGADLPSWHVTWNGMAIGIAIYWIWILALLPKMPLMAMNWKALMIVLVSTCRLLKKNNLKARQKSRRIGLSFLGLGVAGTVLLVAAWMALPAFRLDSLFGALTGLGFGGLMLWLVRTVASHSLGQEAMGFGDVTLMAMIGAFLGWQASLLTFAFSPFAALAIVLFNFLITKQNELAFGPYLCLGAVITLFGWATIWPWARGQFFVAPVILIAVLAFSLVMLAVMMRIVRAIKGI